MAGTAGTGTDTDGGPRLIVGVVSRGEADRHVGAAIRAGAQAATVFVGRGSDAVEQVGASGLTVRSEKEVIVTVVGASIADQVVRAMAQASAQVTHASDFVAKMPVTRVVGLLEAVAMAREAEKETN